MKLYLVQHAESTPEEVDPNRPLTTKGREDAERVAEFIKGLNLNIRWIRHSTKTRAKQTAEILSRAISPKNGVIQCEGLAPNDPIEPLEDELKNIEDNLMIVGHLPFLAKLASFLLGDPLREIIAFRQGGIVCLGYKDKVWRIEWMIVPELLR